MDFILLAYDLICSHLYSSEFGFFSVVAFNNLKSQYKPINSKNSKIDSIQDEGWKYFNEKGLPPNPETIELWKYTNFHDLDSLKFSSPNQTIIDEDAEKNKIATYFDTLFDLLDDDDSGDIDNKEIEPVLKMMRLAKMTSTEIQERTRDYFLKRFLL